MWLLFTIFAISLTAYAARALRDLGNPPVARLSPQTPGRRNVPPPEPPFYADEWRDYHLPADELPPS